MRRSVLPGLVSLALATAVTFGCQKKTETPPPAATTTPAPAPFQVTGIELGKSLTAEKRIAAPTETFGPRDTIYAVVASEGAAKSVTIEARWTFQDTILVAADSQMVAPTGPAWTEFHILKPTKWPVGPYALQVSADGTPSSRKTFQVK
jgi:hypothetical protein